VIRSTGTVANPAPNSSSTGVFREALQLFWVAADGYTRRRLALALALVAIGALLAALTPLALTLVVDRLGSQSAAPGDAMLGMASLILLYVIGQYLWRCSNELRSMTQGHADQRLRRRMAQHLFDHMMRVPMRFHLERKAGAMGETAEQGLRGAQMVIQHLVYTLLPVGIELAAVAIVL
jgi:ABC-type multidrug transport system fused ATPase/permease subunit